MAKERARKCSIPRRMFCTDNGAMIAYAGAQRLQAGQVDDDERPGAATLAHGRIATAVSGRNWGRNSLMDIVYVGKLQTDAVIGVYDWERGTRQTVVLDLELASDNRRAAATDGIAEAVDYDAISRRILDYVQASEFQLIETLAERVAELVLAEFSIPWLRLRLGKPGAVAEAGDVGVIIERGEKPDGEGLPRSRQ